MDELHEHPRGACWVQERYLVTAGPGLGGLVDESVPSAPQKIESGGKVADTVGDVMKAGPALLEEACHRPCGVHRLEKLESSHERDANPLGRKMLDRGTVTAKKEFKNRQDVFDGGHGEGDMVHH